jgi:3-oxoacyl-[acyl-carrier-protein] synthase III
MDSLRIPEVVIERVAGAVGSLKLDNASVVSPETIAATGFAVRRIASGEEDLFGLSLRAAKAVTAGIAAGEIGGVVSATFSNKDRFPGLAVRIAAELGIGATVPVVDLQAACSAYPYALYVAGRLAADTGRKVLLIDGDVQSPLTDAADASTAPLFSDASTATLIGAAARQGNEPCDESCFAFLSRAGDALMCPAEGPIRMDGFKVFSFVAADVTKFLRGFGSDFDVFVPHQANMYMVRQLAKSLGLEDRLVTCGAEYANPGSASVPLALALHAKAGSALLASFGAGLSASAASVRIAPGAALGLS